MGAQAVEVRSWKELQQHVQDVVDRLNDEPKLALAAAANPFFALEEAGYHVLPEGRDEIEDRLRFPPEEAARRRRLRREIYAAADREFDIRSSRELDRVLFDELSITPYPDDRGCVPEPPYPHPLPRYRAGESAPSDPLSELKGRHPIVEPLLEYRRLDASRPQFAPPSAYRKIRLGRPEHGIRRLRIRLKTEPSGDGPGSPGDRPREPSGPGEEPGRIDINTATVSELASLPGIGPDRGQRIVEYREEHGPFEDVRQLTKIPGIGERLLERIETHLST